MPLRDIGHPPLARRAMRRWQYLPAAAGLATALAAGPAIPAAASAAVSAAPASMPGNRVVAWGSNENGELGDGTTTSRRQPVFAKPPARFRYTSVRSVGPSGALPATGPASGGGANNFG